MMKRHVPVILTAAAALILGSCSQQPYEKSDTLIEAIVNDVTSSKPPDPPMSAYQPDYTAAKTSPEVSELSDEVVVGDPVNIDLTTMNSTMIYSVIYDITVNADRYYGKTLMLDGYFDTSYDETLDTRYYFIVVPDAAACCMQGLEFKLGDSAVYPNDYPEVKSDIRVRGTLAQYDELGQTYCYIDADDLTVL